MIVNHEKRWVYLGVPRTASTALHHALPGYGGVQSGQWQHDFAVPEDCWDYRVFATCRNPFRRAYGLWRMLQGDARKGAPWADAAPATALADFSGYVAEVLARPHGDRPQVHWPIWRWLAEAPPAVEVEVIRAEELDTALRRLGVLGPDDTIPARNRTQGNWLDVYDGPTEEAVRRWAEEDFRRFGYEPDLGVWRARDRRARRGEWARAVRGKVRRAIGSAARTGSQRS